MVDVDNKKELYDFIKELVALKEGDKVKVIVINALSPERYDGVYKVRFWNDDIWLESKMADLKLSQLIESLLYGSVTAKIL